MFPEPTVLSFFAFGPVMVLLQQEAFYCQLPLSTPTSSLLLELHLLFFFFFLHMCILKNLFIFNCRIIALQYCAGWPYINMNQTQVYICPLLSPCTPSQPSRLSQSTRFGLPASYSRFPLVS